MHFAFRIEGIGVCWVEPHADVEALDLCTKEIPAVHDQSVFTLGKVEGGENGTFVCRPLLNGERLCRRVDTDIVPCHCTLDCPVLTEDHAARTSFAARVPYSCLNYAVFHRLGETSDPINDLGGANDCDERVAGHVCSQRQRRVQVHEVVFAGGEVTKSGRLSEGYRCAIGIEVSIPRDCWLWTVTEQKKNKRGKKRSYFDII